MTVMIDLPSDGMIDRATFDNLPTPARGWAWELRDGGWSLSNMPDAPLDPHGHAHL